MKNNKKQKKLVLTRTTLRKLTDTDLEKAVGGISQVNCHTYAAVCQGPTTAPTGQSLALFWC